MRKIRIELLGALLLLILINLTSCTNHSTYKGSRLYDFGTIKLEDTLYHTFYFTNTSSLPLEIIDVKANCSCTTLDYSKNPIKNGDSAYIKVRFVPNTTGAIEGLLVFEANTKPPYNIVKIEGVVKDSL